MYVEPAPKVVLQNRLHRCRNKASELSPLMQSKSMWKGTLRTPILDLLTGGRSYSHLFGLLLGEEATSMSSQLVTYTPDSSIGAIDELTDVRTICLELDNYPLQGAYSACRDIYLQTIRR